MANLTTTQRLQQEIDNQDNYYAVLADYDGNRINKRIRTAKEQITIKKCQDICRKIEHCCDVKVNGIRILLTQYDYRSLSADDYELVLSGDCGVPRIGKEKLATYNNKKNILRIWENGLPIYENCNGNICRDTDALADCLL